MEKIGIVTDSTCNLSEKILKENRIESVSLYIHSQEEYKKDVDILPAEFYQQLKKAVILPTTSQPSSMDFEKVYRRLSKEYDVILSIHISAELSGTINSATIAASMVGGDIRIIDSRSASYGLGFIVLEAVKMKEESLTADEIVKKLKEKVISRIEIYFAVSDLMYLYKGGRIGKAKAVLGSAFRLKPILTLREGIIDLFDKARGNSAALEKIISLSRKALSDKKRKAKILHANNEKYAFLLRSKLKDEGIDLEIVALDPVIGVHLGPGAYGIVID